MRTNGISIKNMRGGIAAFMCVALMGMSVLSACGSSTASEVQTVAEEAGPVTEVTMLLDS